MVLTYKELIELFGNDYKIKSAIQNGDLKKIVEGYYTPQDFSYLELLVKRYPNSVFSFTTALYFHGLIKEVPTTYYLTSKKDSTRIADKNVHQFFVESKYLFENVDLIMRDGIQIMIYSKEKTLISLIKNRNKISNSIFHEAILSYRKIANSLNAKSLNILLNRERYKRKFKQIIAEQVL